MRFAVFLSFFLFGLILQAQDSLHIPKKNPKVGLVLSGGGAKGLAHIGVLKVIDSAGVDIDYISGTSMGAIIGSLYASGWSGKQLDSIFRVTDFDDLIQDNLPRRAKSFYERKQSEKYVVSLPFDDFEVHFPSALSKGQNIFNLMMRLTAHLGDVDDFDELPIPFFCIATNIETGEQVVLDRGSLPLAVSASGAIPSLFSPVEIDGKLLVDGGVVNNYPIKLLREKGMDIIIGVNVQDSLSQRKNLDSALEILNQVNNFENIQSMREKRKLTDVYIRPDIADFNILSFGDGKDIIAEGRYAALSKLGKLQKIAERQNGEREDLDIPTSDSIYIKNIAIKGEHGYPRSYVRGKLQIGQYEKTTYEKIFRGINNLSATGNFSRINYNFKPNGKGSDLVLELKESGNKTSLKFALHYDELYNTSVLLNFTHKSLLLSNDILSLDFIVGDNIRYNFDYFIDKGRYWSLGFSSKYDHFEQDVDFEIVRKLADLSDFNVNQVEIKYSDFTNQIYAESFFLDFRLGAGLEHKYVSIKTETIITETELENNLAFTVLEETNLFSTFAYLEMDTYDDKYFPGKGFYFRGDFHAYLLSSKSTMDFSQFAIAKGKIGYAVSPLDKLSLRVSSSLGFRIGDNGTRALDFYLGGYGYKPTNNLVQFFGYDFLEVSGDSYIKALAEVDFEFLRKNHLIASYNIANVGENLFSTNDIFSVPYGGFALGYGLETFLGPVEVKYSYSPEKGESEWFFGIGFWF
jgi:NTE family protein